MPDFEAVWQRVCRVEPALPTVLEGFLCAAGEAADAYAALARATRVRVARRVFLTHAAEQLEAIRRLQAAYYLLTGDSLPRATAPGAASGGLFSALQARHAKAASAAEAYRSAAATAPAADLRELLEALGRMEAAHAAALRKLVDRLL